MALTCPRCNREFKNNSNLNRHLARKTPCDPDKSTKISLNIIKSTNVSNSFITIFDIPRGEGIIGIEAYRQIIPFVALKLLEKDLQLNKYVFNPSLVLNTKIVKKIIEERTFLWSNLIKTSDEYILTTIKEVLMTLNTNLILKEVFPNANSISFKHSSTLRQILDKIDAFDICGDSFGDIYEDILSRQYMGKDLGQFFTPRWIRKYIISLVNPQLDTENKAPSICDPAAGTGGFLATAISYLKKQGEVKNLNESLYGIEINEDTHKSGIIHMIISLGEPIKSFQLGDSLRNSVSKQFDYVVSNPPFGLKGIKWIETTCPIKTNNGTSLFLQQIIKILKIGGVAGIVFPMGQELWNNTEFRDLRMLLLKCCNMHAIIKLPKQTFPNTACATCILCFTKVYEIDDILSIKMNGQLQERYFSESTATQHLNFYEIEDIPNDEKIEVKHTFTINLDEVEDKNWSLHPVDYSIKKDKLSEWPLRQLKTVCTFKNGTNITKAKLKEGPYLVIGGGRSPLGTHNTYNIEANTIVIAKDGSAGYVSRYPTPVFVTNHGIFIDTIDTTVLPDFLYLTLKYYLQDEIYTLQRGAAQPGIKKEQVAELYIPVPSLEKQQIIDTTNIYFIEIDKAQNKIKDLQQQIIDTVINF